MKKSCIHKTDTKKVKLYIQVEGWILKFLATRNSHQLSSVPRLHLQQLQPKQQQQSRNNIYYVSPI